MRKSIREKTTEINKTVRCSNRWTQIRNGWPRQLHSHSINVNKHSSVTVHTRRACLFYGSRKTLANIGGGMVGPQTTQPAKVDALTVSSVRRKLISPVPGPRFICSRSIGIAITQGKHRRCGGTRRIGPPLPLEIDEPCYGASELGARAHQSGPLEHRTRHKHTHSRGATRFDK